jgi:hypothetical protein
MAAGCLPAMVSDHTDTSPGGRPGGRKLLRPYKLRCATIRSAPGGRPCGRKLLRPYKLRCATIRSAPGGKPGGRKLLRPYKLRCATIRSAPGGRPGGRKSLRPYKASAVVCKSPRLLFTSSIPPYSLLFTFYFLLASRARFTPYLHAQRALLFTCELCSLYLRDGSAQIRSIV